MKWWWLIVVAGLLAGATSYIVLRDQPAIYTAKTTLMIGRTITDPNPSGNEFWLNQQLSSLYTDMAYRSPVQTGVKEALGLDWLPQYKVKPLGNSQFLEISVMDTDPMRAMRVANELAANLVQVSPGGSQGGADSDRQLFMQDQLAKLQEQIVATENEIADKQASLGSLTSAKDVTVAREDLRVLQEKLTLLRSNYTSLLDNAKPNATNTLQVLEAASLPTQPTGLNKYILVALAAIAGMALGIGGAYLLNFMDETVQDPKEVEKIFDRPILGYLADVGRKFSGRPYVANHPRSLVAESFRSLRANLELMSREDNLKTILITSAEQSDGKTSVSTNLAVSFMQGGKRVILVDGDIRKPSLHELFDVDENCGLVDLLAGTVPPEKAMHQWGDSNLHVVPVGKGTRLPDQILTPQNVENLLEDLKPLADYVIIDSSPFLVSDAMIFASKVDGVLAVVRPGHTNRGITRVMRERILIAGGNILGVVLNRVTNRRMGYYGDYRYYAPYGYYLDEKNDGEEKVKVKAARK
ncbi:MAG: polysaccharide biosynthesis tyrosine autokinase [Anaerolineae bacterium]|nr:polysaccharide biosynthesis tyrosine autokinase [Anaerolineae bacterium]